MAIESLYLTAIFSYLSINFCHPSTQYITDNGVSSSNLIFFLLII